MTPPEDESQSTKSLRQLALAKTRSLAQAKDVSYDTISKLPWPVQKDLWDQPSCREQQLERLIARLASVLPRTDLEPQSTGDVSYNLISNLPLQSQKHAWHQRIEREQQLEQCLARLESDVPLIDREAFFGIDPNQNFIDQRPDLSSPGSSAVASQQANPSSEWQRLIDHLHCSLRAHEGIHGQADLGIQYDRRIQYRSARFVKNNEDSTSRWGLCFDESCNHDEHFALTELISPSLFRCRLSTFLQGYSPVRQTDARALIRLITFGPFGIAIKEDSVLYMMIGTLDRKENRVAELCINVLLGPIDDLWDGPSLRQSTEGIEALSLESRQMALARRYGNAAKALKKEMERELDRQLERELERERPCSRRAETRGYKKSSRSWLRL
ncbi:uncharacterized protein AB675_11527 [Cyphellophora attinorum]|uniref:Uncharacterized protein n=1 Tax=Cyphellophora attinorum TaxID=1664694 RepID=A0A0N1H8W8_9EURO|nr:uncharacterized protein AB675_11527 [Phialophora attinorum]KPI39895.1 hypothetical protein AB675_11527 [Phialophora attinorum]